MKTKQKLLLFMAAFIATTLILIMEASAAQIVIKVGSSYQPGVPADRGVARFAELVKQRTDGRIEVQHFGAWQLGAEKDLAEGARLGTIQFSFISPGMIGSFVREFTIFPAPYLFRDLDHYLKVVRGPIGKELSEKVVKAAGFRLLNMGWYWGVRHITTRKTPVYRPDHLKGQKIRTPDVPAYVDTIRALGATATPMAMSEVYTSLQTGTIDGQENPSRNIKAYNLQDVQKYIILDGHIIQCEAPVINERFWQSLSEGDRKIISMSMLEAEDFQNALQLREEREALTWLQEVGGMTAIVPDLDAFQAATAKTFPEKYRNVWGDLWERIKAVQ